MGQSGEEVIGRSSTSNGEALGKSGCSTLFYALLTANPTAN